MIGALLALVDRHPSWGMPRLFKRLRDQSKIWNKKRVERVHNMLNVRRKGKLRVPTRTSEPISAPSKHNDSWSMNFMSDALNYGHPFRTLNVLDDYNRQASAIAIDTSLTTGELSECWKGSLHGVESQNKLE
ncbi:hypothetical protein J8M20_11805 [Pseudoalteromonas luteoviolacea]|uniref:hypothetical protein n=1 Tax=Pseudoalteromonas luteoviolacea TaxID=43657 RepID=UPI001B35838E|nr:hypothetical protein [Pseudoalteromonas luteoviolacea]MBQ4812030.1 hypothetical protein [Pseudoalteromonas luteoviolacea]